MITNSKKISVWIGTDSTPTEGFGVEEPYVILIRTSKSTSESSKRIIFEYKLYQARGKSPITGKLYLGHLPNKDKQKIKHFSDGDNNPLPAEQYHAFFTLQQDMQAYRYLIGNLGVKISRQFLVSINDLVAIKNVNDKRAIYQAATKTRTFMTEFLRNSETFFAFYNADSVLRGLKAENLEKISSELQLKFKLKSFTNHHDLAIRFDARAAIPKRIVVIIGKNGTGKSRSLYNFTDSLLIGDERLLTSEGKRPLVNRLLAVCSPGETSTSFPANPRHKRLRYLRVMLGREQPRAGAIGMGEAVLRLARSEESIGGRDRWSIFIEAVSNIINTEDVFVKRSAPAYPLPPRRIDNDEGHDLRKEMGYPIPLSKMRLSEKSDCLENWERIDTDADLCRYIDGEYIPLSSGQITFLRFAAQVSLFIENGTMVLIDEPETHLHPNLVTDFIRLLENLLEGTGSYSVLATHSAYFVREVSRSQVIILRESENHTVEVIHPRLKTLGADIGNISQFIFEDPLFGHLVEKVRAQIIKEPMNAKRLLSGLEDELSVEAWMHLQRTISKGAINEAT
jgi:AAA domain, putative AbiEii toxin, Type IV TA system